MLSSGLRPYGNVALVIWLSRKCSVEQWNQSTGRKEWEIRTIHESSEAVETEEHSERSAITGKNTTHSPNPDFVVDYPPHP
ncbi:hypothetical protein WG66_003274 [Moniliophthora roreri]|nr:hypothetical protein WG66_003274 [Moniliophthora roreri]